jgi:hypothetical protein
LGSQVLNLRNEITVKDKQMTLLKEKLHDQCVEVNISIFSYLIIAVNYIGIILKLSNTSGNMQRLSEEVNCLKSKRSLSYEDVNYINTSYLLLEFKYYTIIVFLD